MEKELEKEADRLIAFGRGVVTEGGRLDLPDRLPICNGMDHPLDCPGMNSCIFGLFWRYRGRHGFSGNDLAIVCPCWRKKKKIIMALPSNLSYGMFFDKIDYWSESVYEDYLPWIISLYSPDFWKIVLKYIDYE